ncbi:MAG: hypothetical protein ILO10_06530 [Kiritimatiellae bacterium]|nr:hypothetical protein [Kiritimatiellia bacterium]
MNCSGIAFSKVIVVRIGVAEAIVAPSARTIKPAINFFMLIIISMPRTGHPPRPFGEEYTIVAGGGASGLFADGEK